MLTRTIIIALAMGLLLPGASPLAQTAQEQAEKRARTEQQEMLQSGTQAAGEQELVQERTRTREELQTREQNKDAKQYQKRTGQDDDTDLSGERLHERDRTRDRDRIHEPGGAAARTGGRR